MSRDDVRGDLPAPLAVVSIPRSNANNSVRRQLSSIVIAAAWLAALVVGFDRLWRYETRPGTPAAAPERWPNDSTIALDGSRMTLLVFAHPLCPCSRATIGELDRIAARTQGRVHPVVVFVSYADLELRVEDCDLWKRAAAIPGALEFADRDGELSRRFRVHTSGETLLYDADGELLFDGGITGARGHEGDNLGADSVIACAAGREPRARQTPVFGCSLAL